MAWYVSEDYIHSDHHKVIFKKKEIATRYAMLPKAKRNIRLIGKSAG